MRFLPAVSLETCGAVAWRQAEILVITHLIVIALPRIRLVIQVQLHAIYVREWRLPTEKNEGKKG